MEKELVYLYIEDYQGFKKREFNFTPEVRFSLRTNEDTGERYLEKTLNSFPEKFWGDCVQDISLLIGDNGSGKTRIMMIICEWIYKFSKKQEPREKGIMIFKYEDRYGVLCFLNGELINICESKNKTFVFSPEDFRSYLEDLKIIYFTNTMTELPFIANNHEDSVLIDCSLPRRIVESWEQDFQKSSLLTNYNRQEFSRQVELVLDHISDISVSSVICMKLKRSDKNGESDSDFQEIGNLIGDGKSSFVKNLQDFWNYYFKEDILKQEEWKRIPTLLIKALFTGFIFHVLKWEKENIGKIKDNNILSNILASEIAFMRRFNANVQTGISAVNRVFKDIIFGYCEKWEENFSDEGFSKETVNDIEQYIKMLAGADTNIKIDSFFNKFKKPKVMHDVYVLQLNKENSDFFREFWKRYKKIERYVIEDIFCWNASSGEKNLFGLMSMLSNISAKTNNVWLFLDEPDNTFHPDWKRTLTHKLIDIIEEIYKRKKVQLFLSTHSPIILSDFPKAAAIYLKAKRIEDASAQDKELQYIEYKKEEHFEEIAYEEQQHEETFAQNIYVLFRDSFFLEDGVIGSFAADKITDVMIQLNQIKKKLKEKEKLTLPEIETIKSNLEECQKIINLTAEPLIKNQMTRELKDCRKLLIANEPLEDFFIKIDTLNIEEKKRIKERIAQWQL